MKSKQILILLFCCSIFACQQSPPLQFGEAAQFFPPAHQLQQGIVNKYYIHNFPVDPNQDKSMDIQYYSYQLIAPDSLEISVYDAATDLIWCSIYFFEKDKVKITDRYRVVQGDTSKLDFISNEFLDWISNEAILESSMMIGPKKDYKRWYKSNQIAHRDTLVEGRKGQLFEKDIKINIFTPENDTIKYKLNQTVIYVENMGVYAEYIKMDQSNSHLELIEQMTLDDFRKHSLTVPKRVAYIDPKNNLDDNNNFKICGQEVQIADYYNGDEIGQLIGGKGQWWRILETELKSSKLHNESGFLTYRFVVNCQGQAGRFVTEQADLNYNKKAFHPETVDHFYEIVSNQKEWQPCKIKEDIRDAYVYVTFKLKDGKVIEILP